MIIAINYADEKFEHNRQYNTRTAYLKGKVDKVIEYSPQDIDEEFKVKHTSILSDKKGAGLWLWKPYIILKTLETLTENDYLFYSDAGTFYVNKVQYLIDCLEDNNQFIMPFELPLLSRQWTKKETYKLMNYDDYDTNQILATYILFKRNNQSVNFVKEWLIYCCDERILSPTHFTDIKEFDDFVEHREDQSILDILCRKNQLISFRDPSQYGERPWQYAWIKQYAGKWKEWTFRPKKYKNSCYPRIVVCNRISDPVKFKNKEILKTIMNKLGLYSKYFFAWKNKAKIH